MAASKLVYPKILPGGAEAGHQDFAQQAGARMNSVAWFGLGALAMLVFMIVAPNIWLAIYVRVFGRMP